MEKMDFKGLFKKALNEKFGSSESLEIIEQRLSHLRFGTPLKYQDLQTIADDALWPFSSFWKWPSPEQIEKDLADTGDLFLKIKDDHIKNERVVITKLNQIFKNIALVSILLRFIFPEYYGIYSTPVLHVSGTERGKNATEDYLNYLKVLRSILDIIEIRERYGVRRVADVDMLLFAVAELGDEYLDEFNSLYAKGLRPEEPYLIRPHPDFFKSIDKYDNATKGRILEAILHLSKDPKTSIGDTIKPLSNYSLELSRFRLGNFRLIYYIDNSRKVVILIYFGKRDEIYKILNRNFKK